MVDLLLPTIYDKEFGGPRITDTFYVDSEKTEFLTKYDCDIICK